MNLFHATALTLFAAATTATAQSFTHPADLAPGDQYRILVVTDTTRDALSTDIADYNAFVAGEIGNVADLAALNVGWRALAGTAAVDARDNTGTNPSAPGIQGVPIYLRDGQRLADNYDDLWDGALAAAPNVTSSGAVTTGERVWSGGNQHGISFEPNRALGGAPTVLAGIPSQSSAAWMFGNLLSPTDSRPLYALSAVIMVPFPQPAVEIVRLGVPGSGNINPDALRPGATSGPVIGQTWDPFLDHSVFVPNAIWDFLLISPPFTNGYLIGPLANGSVLVDLGAHVAVINYYPELPFALPLPNDMALVGGQYTVQGVSIDDSTPPLHFANVLDITIGEV